MDDFSMPLVAMLSLNIRVGIVECSVFMYFIVFQNCFLSIVFTFLLKNSCLELRSIVVTLFLIVLNLFQSCEVPDNLAFPCMLFLDVCSLKAKGDFSS